MVGTNHRAIVSDQSDTPPHNAVRDGSRTSGEPPPGNETGLKTDILCPAPIRSRELPPQRLSRWDERYNFLRHYFIPIGAFGMVGGPICFGLLVAHQSLKQGAHQMIDFASDLCDRDAATGVERAFLIDLRFGGDFSFVQAKGIDLLWDVVVGQGGRFVHAWILYRFVVADALVWTMEHSSVPYEYFISLSFDAVSFVSLWILIKTVFQRRTWRTVLTSLWFVYAIAYTLSFATFWSASTGYLAPNTRGYRMPDGGLVFSDSPELAFCWTFEGSRLGLGGDIIEIGPTFQELFYQWDIGWSSSADPWVTMGLEWNKTKELLGTVEDVSDNFRNIYAYALAIRSFQSYLNYTGTLEAGYDVVLSSASVEASFNMSDDAHYSKDANSMGSWSIAPTSSPGGLPSTLYGWQYTGIGQRVPGEDIVPDSNGSLLEIRAYYTHHLLDLSVGSGPGLVPYNSTIWYDNEAITLEAPFLNIGEKCNHSDNVFQEMGNCVCYLGEPITTDWYARDNRVCVNKPGYAWGFSTVMTLIGLCLEAAWAIGCWSVWIDAQINSKLLRWRRRGGGVIRIALDLAESVNRDLGNNTCAYPNEALEKELDKCESIAYSAERNDSGVGHIGLVTGSVRLGVNLDGQTLYGRSQR